ncbi:MAG: NAD(P)-dependent oxidoreductase [Pseudomonadota bacterium]
MEILVAASRMDDWRSALEGQSVEDCHFHFLEEGAAPTKAMLQAEVAFGAPDVLPRLMEQMPALRWVQSTWAGVTPFLACPRRDYQLTGIKGIFGASMSEYVLGWVLALRRSVLRHALATHWDSSPDPGLSALRIGIAGTGDIGTTVAQRSAPFFREVVGLNSVGRPSDGFARCFATDDVASFAKDLDVLVMLLPDVTSAHGLINTTVISELATGAILINGGRASSLVLPDAIKALESQLSACVLDVLDTEPLEPGDPLWSTPGVHITSHTAAPSYPSQIVEFFQKNLRRFKAGEALVGLVDFERGY